MTDTQLEHTRINGWCSACGGLGVQAILHRDTWRAEVPPWSSSTSELPVLDSDSARLALVVEALDLISELWPIDGDYKTLTPDTWRRLRRVLLSVPTMVNE